MNPYKGIDHVETVALTELVGIKLNFLNTCSIEVNPWHPVDDKSPVTEVDPLESDEITMGPVEQQQVEVATHFPSGTQGPRTDTGGDAEDEDDDESDGVVEGEDDGLDPDGEEEGRLPKSEERSGRPPDDPDVGEGGVEPRLGREGPDPEPSDGSPGSPGNWAMVVVEKIQRMISNKNAIRRRGLEASGDGIVLLE